MFFSMKKIVCLLFVSLFLFASASTAVARDRHHGHHRYRHHNHQRHYGHHYRYHDGWRRYPRYYYGIAPLVVFNFDRNDYQPLSPPPYRVIKERVVEVERILPEEREDLSQVISRRSVAVGQRLDALRTQAARDYKRKSPMPYDTFDSMSPEERRAYGEEWDRLKRASGDSSSPF